MSLGLFFCSYFLTSYLIDFPPLDSSEFGNTFESVAPKTVPCQCWLPKAKQGRIITLHMLPTALLSAPHSRRFASFVTESYYDNFICHSSI